MSDEEDGKKKKPEFGMHELICCWKELVYGHACCVWNCLFSPCMLCIWAWSIYCCGCIRVYLNRGFFKFCCCLCRLCGCCWLYTDKEFPPGPESLGDVNGDSANAEAGKSNASVVWLRANDFPGGAKMQLFGPTVDSRDICQGALGDCWLLAAMACLAEHKGAMQGVFKTKERNPKGKYVVRLYDGQAEKWRSITIDDYVPCDKDAYEKKGEYKPLYTQPNGNELYAMLLEKAFAKFCGGYGAIEGGQTIWAIRAMTGDPARWFAMEKDKSGWKRQDLVNLQDPKNKRKCKLSIRDEIIPSDAMFEVLLKYQKLRSVLCASGSSGTCGLHKGHAYSILDVKKVNTGLLGVIGGKTYRMIKIRNPWGEGEWTGDWSDDCNLWSQNPKVKSACKHENSDDGSFWMCWEDFVKHWERIGVCDRTIDITSLNLTVRNDTALAPLWACLRGCGYFWCMCQGIRRLYCAHRSSDETVKVGGFCGFCQKSAQVHQAP
eukprot:TRINITY_DN48022_c0_g1_i1.p1 TRINITY_DN48022_c0_g1~~TRINITY_DN48022_c0_g1_i1.p1  ORF type:complete len:490 (-),score=64.70 TRINITY_DN48022_c0_g1_i1:262-1731(-)